MTRSLFRRLTLLAGLSLALWGGCQALHPNRTVEPTSKLDAPLRLAVSAASGEEDANPIQVFVGCDGEPSEDQARQLEADGLRILGISGRIVMAEGPTDALLAAARRPFVRQISQSQTRPPL